MACSAAGGIPVRSALMDTFLGRVNYCQRLAARRAALPGLGWGWRKIMLARVGPIFDPGRFSDKVHKRAVIWFVFKKLQELRDQLESEGQHDVKLCRVHSRQLGRAHHGQSNLLPYIVRTTHSSSTWIYCYSS